MTGNWTLPLDIGTHGTLKFGTAVSNVGNGYNTHTGIFTAPYPGTYLFLLTVLATDYAELEIVENTGRRLAMTGGDRDQVNEDFRRDTVHTALHLNKGDEVWVRHAHSGTTVMQFWWTSFTGVLLQSD
nr:hypothetical protein BaRGS_002412 [Batillaria attramentaria]